MATYDNKHWLLSHIRNSFISTDDTGMCEIVMIGEDFPRLLHAKSMMDKGKIEQTSSPLKSYEDTSDDEYERERVMEFDCYPGMDISDDDDVDPLTESYDLQHDMEFGMHRQRSNTAQRLEKMDQAQRKAARIKMVKWENPPAQVAGQDKEPLFPRKEIKPDFIRPSIIPGVPQRRSLLSDLLEKCPFLPQSQYSAYAKIDGSAQLRLPTKTFKIFMTMMPEELRNYPIHVCVMASAKIEELIGLTCYVYSIAHPEAMLGPVQNYGLCISEDDGEVDWDFPCLDSREPCSKFGLTCLGLVDLKSYALTKSSEAHTSSIPEKGGFNTITLTDETKSTDHTARSRSATFDSKEKPRSQDGITAIKGIVNKNTRGVQRTSSSVTFGDDANRTVSVLVDNLPRRDTSNSNNSRSAPAGTSVDFDFGRVQSPSPQETAALRRMKLHEQDIDAPLYQSFRVHVVNRMRSNTEVLLGISKERIEINPLPKGSNKFWYRMKPVSYNMDSIAWCEKFEPKNNRSTFRIVYYQVANAESSSIEVSPNTPTFKHTDFECDLLSSFLIVNKINRILELQSSACRKEYKAAYDRKLQARRSFHLPKKI